MKSIAAAEKQHERRYLGLLDNIKKGQVFKKDNVVKWKCGNCGYIHEGEEAPEECPACVHPQAHFELLGEKYKNNHPDSEEEVWIPIKEKII